MNRKIAIAITGASGSIYASRLIQKFLSIQDQWQELSVVMTENAKEVWQVETGKAYTEHEKIKHFSNKDFHAPFASGSAKYDTMIIVPCSMGALGRIAHGISNDLITRAADVILKERRKLICVARETPYSLIHLENMKLVTLAGGIICPATPSFYSCPSTIEEIVDTVVDRVLDIAGFDIKAYRWGK